MPEIAAASPALREPAASAATCASICVKSALCAPPTDRGAKAPALPVSAPTAPVEVTASNIVLRAPRKIALFDCAHWMRERHAGFVARDRNGSAWLFRP